MRQGIWLTTGTLLIILVCLSIVSAQGQVVIDQPLYEATIPGQINKVEWHPDGHILAVASHDAVTLYSGSLEPVAQLPAAESLSWSPAGDQLAVTAYPNVDIWSWDNATASLEPVISLEADEPARLVYWSPNGDWLAVIGGEGWFTLSNSPLWLGRIYIWDTATWQQISVSADQYLMDDRYSFANVLDWHPNGLPQLVGIGGPAHREGNLIRFDSDLIAYIIDIQTGEWIESIPLFGPKAFSVDWHPTGDTIAVGDDPGVTTYDIATSSIIHTYPVAIIVETVEWSPDGRYLSGGGGVADTLSNERMMGQFAGTSPARSIDWHPSGLSLAIGSRDGRLTIENLTLLPGYQPPAPLPTDSGTDEVVLEPVWSIAWNHDGSRIAMSGGPRQCDPSDPGKFAIRVFDAVTGQITQRLIDHSCFPVAVDWSPDGTKLVSSFLEGYKGYGAVWDIATGEILTKTPNGIVTNSAWSPDGTMIASGSGGVGVISIWDPITGDLAVDNFFGGSSLDWNPDSSRLVTSDGEDNTVLVWDVASGKIILTLEGHTDSVGNVDWSIDGSKIASESADNTARIWDATTGQLLHTLLIGDVTDVEFSPDSQKLVTSTRDGIIQVWDADTGDLLDTIVTSERLYTVAWSPDGNALAYSRDNDPVIITLGTNVDSGP